MLPSMANEIMQQHSTRNVIRWDEKQSFKKSSRRQIVQEPILIKRIFLIKEIKLFCLWSFSISAISTFVKQLTQSNEVFCDNLET